MAPSKQNPPPVTKQSKVLIRKAKSAREVVEVHAEVLLDGTTKDKKVKGSTSFRPVGAWPDGKGGTYFFQTPGYSWEKRGNLEVVTRLSGPVEIKGTVTIQTVYGPDASPTVPSGYGRGTTPEDEKAGDTSLGFHESCHRANFLTFLKTKPFPAFGGKVGLTRKKYDQAVAAFGTAMKKYFQDMEKESNQRTDEVGYKKSTYLSKGPRP